MSAIAAEPSKKSHQDIQEEDVPTSTSAGTSSGDFVTAEEQSVQTPVEIFSGQTTIEVVDEEEQGEVPPDVDELHEKNDLTVLGSQLSSDEVVTGSGILNVEKLINESRLVQDDEEEEQEQEDSDYESQVHDTTLTINIWEIVKRGAINLVLPFINGMMLGFGEILAHEIGFRYNWAGAKVEPPRRLEQRRREPSKFL